MYTNQQCYVQWGPARSDTFKIFNGVKQGGVISQSLYTLYVYSSIIPKVETIGS